MIEPQRGDRIERWLLKDSSPFAERMSPAGVPPEEWDPEEWGVDELPGADPGQFDPVVQFEQHIATKYVDYLLVPSGAQVSAVYEMVACLPSPDSDGHTTYRVLMRLKSRTDPH